MSIFSHATLSRHKSSTASIETTPMPAIETPKVSVHIKSLPPAERVVALEKKLEELSWELENEHIIANKLNDMPTGGKKKSFVAELNFQKEIVAQRLRSLSEQVEVHRRELEEARNEEIKATVSKKDEQLSDLQRRLDAVIAHRNQLQAQMVGREEELLSEVERLEAGRYTLSKHVLALNAQIAMLRAERTGMEAVVQQTRHEMDDLREVLKKTQSSSSSSSQSLSPNTPPMVPPRRPPPPVPSAGESPGESVERERQELLKEKAKLLKEREEMETTLACLVQEKAVLEGRVEERAEERRTLMERLSEQEKANVELQREVAELKHQLEEQMIFDQSKRNMEEEHSNALREAGERLGAVQAQCRKQAEDLQQSMSAAEQVQSRLDAALRTIEDKQEEISLNNKTIANLRSALAQAASEGPSGANAAQIHQLNLQISELKSQFASAEERARADRKRAEESLKEVERLRGEVREQERLVEEGKRRVEEEVQERIREGERATGARTKLVAEMAMAREREVAKRDRELESLREELSSLKKTAGDAKSQLSAAERQLEKSRGESEALNEALMRTIQQKLELAAQVEQWEQDMSHLINNSVARHA